jgi:hypothetical protein
MHFEDQDMTREPRFSRLAGPEGGRRSEVGLPRVVRLGKANPDGRMDQSPPGVNLSKPTLAVPQHFWDRSRLNIMPAEPGGWVLWRRHQNVHQSRTCQVEIFRSARDLHVRRQDRNQTLPKTSIRPDPIIAWIDTH